MEGEDGIKGSFWKSFGPILLIVAAGAISIALAMNTDSNGRQDRDIEVLKDARSAIQERLGRIETDIEHVKRSQQDTHDDVKEIRRLLEGPGPGGVR